MTDDRFETVDWRELADGEVAVVDGEHIVECSRAGQDANGEWWLNTPGAFTRGPMRDDRVEIGPRPDDT